MNVPRCGIHILSAILLAHSESALAEDPPSRRPDGFVDVKWGANLETVKRIMLARPGVTSSKDFPEGLYFFGGTFADEAVDRWEFKFRDGQFFEGLVRLEPA